MYKGFPPYWHINYTFKLLCRYMLSAVYHLYYGRLWCPRRESNPYDSKSRDFWCSIEVLALSKSRTSNKSLASANFATWAYVIRY